MSDHVQKVDTSKAILAGLAARENQHDKPKRPQPYVLGLLAPEQVWERFDSPNDTSWTLRFSFVETGAKEISASMTFFESTGRLDLRLTEKGQSSYSSTEFGEFYDPEVVARVASVMGNGLIDTVKEMTGGL